MYEISRVVREDQPLPEGYPYPPGTTWLYELRYRAAGGAWKNLCGADAQGARLAIPLAGVYDKANTAHADAQRITFACTRGVMAKCYRWGYRPWLGAEHSAGHQACIRMAMADYCGDGRSWTRDGTLIQRWDRLSPPVQPRTADIGSMSFEAAWTPRGAACLARPRWSGLAPDFTPGRCARPPGHCDSEDDALKRFPDEPLLLFNASRPNAL
ncbi:MAG TPA: ADYC domain-containing protein [Burkholderiales bacterium]|nr:ADYC domain-containing protein [Burkholderiales bacterium]